MRGGARGGWGKNRNVTINNIGGGWERKGESFGVEKVFGGKLRGRKQFIRSMISLFASNENIMLKSRKMSKFVT